MPCGGVPRDWRLRRTIYSLRLQDPLPFLDVENASTLSSLERELTSTLVALGYEGNIDVADIRGRDRRLSRAIAEWAYVAQDAEGNPLYSGIRYNSRLGVPEPECWAVFQDTLVTIASQEAIDVGHPAVEAICRDWDIRVF